MFPAGLFQIRDALLRGLLGVMGVLFVGAAAGLLRLHDWQADESRLILLVPAVSGAVLIAFARWLRGFALRVALTMFLAAMTALPWLFVTLSSAMGD